MKIYTESFKSDSLGLGLYVAVTRRFFDLHVDFLCWSFILSLIWRD